MYVPMDPALRSAGLRGWARTTAAKIVRTVTVGASHRLLPNGVVMADAINRGLALPDDVVSVGRWTYFDGVPNVQRYPNVSGERIRVGSFTSIAKDVTFFLGGNHDTSRVTTSPVRSWFPSSEPHPHDVSGRGDTVIGNDVWIGRGAVFLSGAVVGDGAVVGAGAVVSGVVEPYMIVVGNPAREVRRRFRPEIVSRLQASRWWDLPDDRIRELVDLLSSHDVEAFLSAVEPRTDLLATATD